MELIHGGLTEDDGRKAVRELAEKYGITPNDKMIASQRGKRVECPHCRTAIGPMTSEAPDAWAEWVTVCPCGTTLVARCGPKEKP